MGNGREFDQPGVYQVRIRGSLDEGWSDWFEGMVVVPQADNETLLNGSVDDQIALHGLLAKIRDLGLTLLSVQRVEKASDDDEKGAMD